MPRTQCLCQLAFRDRSCLSSERVGRAAHTRPEGDLRGGRLGCFLHVLRGGGGGDARAGCDHLDVDDRLRRLIGSHVVK